MFALGPLGNPKPAFSRAPVKLARTILDFAQPRG
jgi:hypothetical protein